VISLSALGPDRIPSESDLIGLEHSALAQKFKGALFLQHQDVISMQDIFRFTRTGIDSEGRVLGGFGAASLRPRILDRLTDLGLEMPPELARIFPAHMERLQ